MYEVAHEEKLNRGYVDLGDFCSILTVQMEEAVDIVEVVNSIPLFFLSFLTCLSLASSPEIGRLVLLYWKQ